MASQVPSPPPEPVVDLVTHIQGETTALCAHFFNFTGSLQRDAPAVSLDGEPLPAASQAANGAETLAQIPAMAEQESAQCFADCLLTPHPSAELQFCDFLKGNAHVYASGLEYDVLA